jgi:hypothetical protein
VQRELGRDADAEEPLDTEYERLTQVTPRAARAPARVAASLADVYDHTCRPADADHGRAEARAAEAATRPTTAAASR